MTEEKGFINLIIVLFLISFFLLWVYLIYDYIKRTVNEKKRRKIQKQYKKLYPILYKKAKEDFVLLARLPFNDIPRITNIKKLIEFEINSKNELLAIQENFKDNAEERAKADICLACIKAARSHLIKIFCRLLRDDVQCFVHLRDRKECNRIIKTAGNNVAMQFITSDDAMEVANAFIMMNAGLLKYHDVMVKISENIPKKNIIIEKHVWLIEFNAFKIKETLSFKSIGRDENICLGEKSYGCLQILGESIEKKMVEYFEYIDVIYSELKHCNDI